MSAVGFGLLKEHCVESREAECNFGIVRCGADPSLCFTGKWGELGTDVCLVMIKHRRARGWGGVIAKSTGVAI